MQAAVTGEMPRKAGAARPYAIYRHPVMDPGQPLWTGQAETRGAHESTEGDLWADPQEDWLTWDLEATAVTLAEGGFH